MLLKENPLTTTLHDYWREKIALHFDDYHVSESKGVLSLKEYIFNSPQKFYSEVAFKTLNSFFNSLIEKDPNWLAKNLNEEQQSLSLANKTLSEINFKKIHENVIESSSSNHGHLINFIDKEIHYTLLKLYESPLYNFIYLLAKYSRLSRKKGTDSLDLYNCIEELKNSDFAFIKNIFEPTVRNGIAHGKVVFTDYDIHYHDKKGNISKLDSQQVIKLFDKVLDIVNGFNLAYKMLFLTKPDFIGEYNVTIPQSILLEELKLKVDTPSWSIINSLDSVALGDKKQLAIYINNNFLDFNKVQLFAFYTAYWGEELTKNYDRVFIHLHSKYAKIGPTGWAAYDGTILRENREKQTTDIVDYKGVLEGDMVFYTPKFELPRLIHKLSTLFTIYKISFPVVWKDFKEKNRKTTFTIRETDIYQKNKSLIIRDTRIVIQPDFVKDCQSVIRLDCKKLIKKTIRFSKRRLPFFSYKRLLPISYIRVFIYDSDDRVRSLVGSGLSSELIASIEVNTSSKIQTIDILGGVPEIIGKYRIVWNKNWKGFKS